MVVGEKLGHDEEGEWRSAVEALSRWTYRVYPETSAGREHPWPATGRIRSWWAELSDGARRSATVVDDPVVVALARGLARGGATDRYEVDVGRRRARFRRLGTAELDVAERAASQAMAERATAILDAGVLRDAEWFPEERRRHPRRDLDWETVSTDDGCRRLAMDVDLETLDVVAGRRSFSTPCTADKAEDGFCRLSWFKAEEGHRGVTLGQVLANVAEALIWRKFWRDHDMSSRRGKRLAPAATVPPMVPALDEWWTALAGDDDRCDAVRRALAAHAAPRLASAGRKASARKPWTFDVASAAVGGLVTCLEALTDASSILTTPGSLPSALLRAPLGATPAVDAVNALVWVAVDEVRCRAASDALLEAETTTPPASPCRPARKGKKRRGKKKRCLAVECQATADDDAMTSRRAAAARVIARRWRSYAAKKRPAAPPRRLAIGKSLRRSSTLPLDVGRSCPPPSCRREADREEDDTAAWHFALHPKKAAKEAPARPAVVSCSTTSSSRGGGGAKTSVSSSSSWPRSASAPHKACQGGQQQQQQQQEHADKAVDKLDLTKTADGATSYSDALRKNTPAERPPRPAAEPTPAAVAVEESDDERDDVIWRLTRANLALRRDNLDLQAEISRLYAEVSAQRDRTTACPPRDAAIAAAAVDGDASYGGRNDHALAPTLGYVYYRRDATAFHDVASDDGRLTTRSDLGFPPPTPLEAVRECAVLLPTPRLFDARSRGSSAVCEPAKLLADDSLDRASEDDDDDDDDEWSDERDDDTDDSDRPQAKTDDDERWATTTTRGSGKPASLARAHLSLDGELADDLMSSSSRSTLDDCGGMSPQASSSPRPKETPRPPPQQRKRRKVRIVCVSKRVLVDETLFSTSSWLAEDVRAFAEGISRQQRLRDAAWRGARELVRDVAKALWPRARVEPYGSCVTRLSLADAASDVDLVIRLPRVRVATPAMTPGDLEGRNAIKETWPQELARRLRSSKWVEANSVRTIASAFVPIVKLRTVPLDENGKPVNLDVSFESPWHRGLDANRLVLKMLDDMPAARPLLLVLKKHAAERGLCASYTGGLSSYALTLLVVRYLQEQPRNDLDPAALLLGFFDFYGHRFDPRKTGISVGRGCFFARAELGARHYGATAGYVALTPDRAVTSRVDHLARSFHFDPLYIEDPLNPGNNVGRNCFRIAQIQRAWSDAYTALSNAIAKASRPVYRGAGSEARRPSLLSVILALPDVVDAAPSGRS